MKTKFKLINAASLMLMLWSQSIPFSTAFAQGTAFTYQGRFNDGGMPANGSYDLAFTLFATNTSGVAIAGPVTNSATEVSNGLFTTVLDFGPGAFIGGSTWLETAVSTNGANAFSTLTPRQQVTPTPYAIYANTASGLANGLRIQLNTAGAPNVLGGASDNFVSSNVIGATIAGGGATNVAVIGRFGTNYFSYTNSVTGNFGTVGGGAENSAGSANSTVSGGFGNSASGLGATVGGGEQNTASGTDTTVAGGLINNATSVYATVSGGSYNVASNFYATVSGGNANIAGGRFAAVGGGYNNYAISNYSTIPGGSNNTASGYDSFAAGANAQALHDGSFVWADSSGGPFTSTAANQFSVRASGGIRLAGDIQIDSSAYHYLSLDGGNSLGFVYGSYPAFGDGIHLGYNYYADASGTGHIINTGGATSRISAGYGIISLLTGYVDGAPFQGLTVNGGSVNVSTSIGVDIGSATPQATIDIYGDIIYRGNGIWNVGISSSGTFGFVPSTSGSDVAYIDTSGNYHQVSDRELKRNVTSLDHTLDLLLQLHPVSYHFRSEPTNSSPTLGLIAQEVQPLFPEVVGEQANGVKDLVYSELIPITIRSIQELNQKLETQLKQKDSEIQDLKQSNEVLARRLQELQTAVNELQKRN